MMLGSRAIGCGANRKIYPARCQLSPNITYSRTSMKICQRLTLSSLRTPCFIHGSFF